MNRIAAAHVRFALGAGIEFDSRRILPGAFAENAARENARDQEAVLRIFDENAIRADSLILRKGGEIVRRSGPFEPLEQVCPPNAHFPGGPAAQSSGPSMRGSSAAATCTRPRAAENANSAQAASHDNPPIGVTAPHQRAPDNAKR